MSYKQIHLHSDISSTRASDFHKKISITHLNLNQDIPCELLAQPTQIKNPNIAKNDYQGWGWILDTV